jgi:hypothetical protein
MGKLEGKIDNDSKFILSLLGIILTGFLFNLIPENSKIKKSEEE